VTARINAALRHEAAVVATGVDWVEPMLATLTDRRFSDPDWIYERKLDGERVIAYREHGRVSLLSRNRKRLDDTYPEIADAVAAQPRDCVLDGEVVAFEGRQTSFARLQGRMQLHDARRARASGIAVFYYVFDLLRLDGEDLVRVPLRDRKRLLRGAVDPGDPLRLLPHRVEHGETYYRQACGRGWEGVIAKRASGHYIAGRSPDWLKFKCVSGQEFVIGGFTDPQGSREDFGALLVGYYEGDRLRYAGKVGTGYTRKTLADLGSRMRAIDQPEPPFTRGAHLPRTRVHWVRPRLVAEIGFTEWTSDGMLRHPRYLGLREDKEPREVTRERPGA
jgi:DNA ligase D-like protein (predicted ligase)